MTLPSSLKAGFSLASVSTVESGRMPSSVGEHLVGVLAVVVADGDRNDLVLEAALGRGSGGPLMALRREGIELLTRDAPLVGDHLGADALSREPGLGVSLHHARSERIPELAHDRGAHRRPRHRFHAGGDRDVIGAGHDALGGEVQRLLGGPALAVNRGAGHGLGPARCQDGVAADVEGLLGDLHDAAHDHVVDLGRVELVALRHRLEGLGGQVDGVPVAQLAVALPAGGPDGVDDDCGGHGVSSQSGRPIGAPPVQIARHPTRHRGTGPPGAERCGHAAAGPISSAPDEPHRQGHGPLAGRRRNADHRARGRRVHGLRRRRGGSGLGRRDLHADRRRPATPTGSPRPASTPSCSMPA